MVILVAAHNLLLAQCGPLAGVPAPCYYLVFIYLGGCNNRLLRACRRRVLGGARRQRPGRRGERPGQARRRQARPCPTCAAGACSCKPRSPGATPALTACWQLPLRQCPQRHSSSHRARRPRACGAAKDKAGRRWVQMAHPREGSAAQGGACAQCSCSCRAALHRCGNNVMKTLTGP